MNDLQGTRLGRHHLLGELARGGMGIVWLARAEGPFGFEKLVVVKELKPALAADPQYRAMFLDEARLAARLDHPNIVQTHEVGCEGDRLYMALELLDGCSLYDARKRLGDVPIRLQLRILSEVLAALHYAHEQGVVHRDVSAQNVFLTHDGRVKLLDFGVAKARGEQRAETKVGVLKGSIPYMSPDHASGGTIDRRADIFAVGVHLREAITGKRFWGDLDDVSILRKLVTQELPAFDADPSLAPALRAIVEKATAPRRADRYATAAEMREAIDDYLADTHGSVPNREPTLAALGAKLERSLPSDRRAFRTMLSCHRTAFAVTLPSGAAPPPDAISLPSGDLIHDSSLADARSSITDASARSSSGWSFRHRNVVAAALGVVALVASAWGLAMGAPAPVAVASMTPPALTAPSTTSTAPPAPPAETAAPASTTVEPEPPPAPSASTEPSLPAAEPELPPNPYAPGPP